jgi:hypothetical protein
MRLVALAWNYLDLNPIHNAIAQNSHPLSIEFSPKPSN